MAIPVHPRPVILRVLLLCALIAGFAYGSDRAERLVIRPRSAPAHDGNSPAPYPVTRPKVGLVLSGGGARGIAQVGVIRAFERHGIPIDFIAATSVGAIVGGLYASGWTIEEIDSLTRALPWQEVLSLTGESNRRDLFVDRKVATDRSFLVVRFKGLEPVIPSAVSSGQRLTDLLNVLTLQSPYHPDPSFDHLKIPFRAVATDLVSGRRVVLGEGSLAEALRASSTVPLVFSPVERDSMQLVDGGLLSNVPVDVAVVNGCDIVLAVNSTSGLRAAEEMKAPWQTADQIIGIMMRHPNDEQLSLADIVITPDVGRHSAGDFTGLGSLIAAGEEAAERRIPDIRRLVEARRNELVGLEDPDAGRLLTGVEISREGGGIPDSLWEHILHDAQGGIVPVRDIRDHVELIHALGDVADVRAEVEVDSSHTAIRIVTVPNPVVRAVRFEGCAKVHADLLYARCDDMVGRPLNWSRVRAAVESVLRVYREQDLVLARVDSASLDPGSGTLTVHINEGRIRSITVEGGERTRDSFVLSEFPLREGDLFELARAQQGVTNITSSGLFEYVYLETAYRDAAVVIRLKERPSQLVRLGLRNDDERGLQGSLDIRDEHFRGAGMELGLRIAGGSRNADVVLEYNGRRLFDTYLTFSVSAFYHRLDSYLYNDGPPPGSNRWIRNRIGEYRDMRWGGAVGFGSQLERLGNVTVEYSFQRVHLQSLEGAEALEEHINLALIRLGTVVDTKDSYPFPKSGVGLNLSYEFALEALGGDVGYNAVRLMWETFLTLGARSTFHPRLTAGFADKTMPFAQQFRFGGRDSFFGLREDDRRGRQLLLANLEYRYRMPFQLFFDTYLQARYDVGTISAVPEEIKFKLLRHGLGVELALDTPVGPAIFGVGKAFFLSRNLPDNPVQWGPTLLYLVIGYQF